MREPPKLAEGTLRTALEAHYGLVIATLQFLPLGCDSGSAVYRVQAADRAVYLLKARAGSGFRESSLAVPWYLRNQGVPHIAAPLPTTSRALWATADGFALSLYPFIDGRLAADVGLSKEQWRTFGLVAKAIHSTRLPPDLLAIVPRETFTPSRRNLIPDLERAIAKSAFADPQERELAAFWRSRRDEIRTLVDRADALGNSLRQSSLPLVLCHADLHTWNVLVDTSQEVWLIDWDETVLAPKERDLMFVVGGIGAKLVKPDDLASFLQGYGKVTIDPCALAYYRYAWAVQDMAAYAERVLFTPDLSAESRQDAVNGFVDVLAPGSIASLALASDIPETQPRGRKTEA